MPEFDLEDFVSKLSIKFDYAFTSICFGTLALSLQFSPNMGDRLGLFLVVSWLLLLLSGFTGGWRLMTQPTFYRLNLAKNELEEFTVRRKQQLSDPQFLTALENDLVTIRTTLKALDLDSLKKTLGREEKKLEIANHNLAKLGPKFPMVFKVQMWTFLMGISLNMLFCIGNLITSKGIKWF